MKFRFSKNLIIDSNVEPWKREGLRIAMLGGPGSGKSWNNSLIAEKFLSQGGTVIIFQPRDEYYTLKEKFDVLSVGGVHAKDMEFALTSPKIYAKAVVEDGISMVFYTSDVESEEKLVDWVARFIRQLLRYQEIHKRPILIILEEAHEYTPKSPSGHVAPPWVYNRMVKAFKDCSTQGRKLNIIQLVSSQRPQELNFTIRQLANLTFYGKFSDQDIGYVDKECLKYVRKQGIEVDASRLVDLGIGEWLVIMGKRTRFVTVTEPRLTKHGAETPRLEYMAPRATKTKKTIDQLSKAVMEALEKEGAEKSELEKAKRKIRDLTKKLEDAEKKAAIKLSVKEMLQTGEGAPQLAEKLANAETEIKDLQDKLAKKKSPEELKELRDTIKKLKLERDNLRKAYDVTVKQLRELSEKAETVKKIKEALLLLLPKQPASPTGFDAPRTTIDLEHKELTVNLHHAGEKEVKMSTTNKEGQILYAALNDLPKEGWTYSEMNKALIEHGWRVKSSTLSAKLSILTGRGVLVKIGKGYRLPTKVKFDVTKT